MLQSLCLSKTLPLLLLVQSLLFCSEEEEEEEQEEGLEEERRSISLHGQDPLQHCSCRQTGRQTDAWIDRQAATLHAIHAQGSHRLSL